MATIRTKDGSEIYCKDCKNAHLEVYKGAPHGLCSTHKDRVNTDLLSFIAG